MFSYNKYVYDIVMKNGQISKYVLCIHQNFCLRNKTRVPIQKPLTKRNLCDHENTSRLQPLLNVTSA